MVKIEIIDIKKKEIAGWLKVARLAAGLTQADLAARLGVGHATVSAWEVGINNPSAAMALVIAEMCEREQLRKKQRQ